MSQQRHPSSRRRPEGKKKEAEDVFVEKILEAADWAKSNTQTLILGLIVIAVVVAGVVYYTGYRTSLEDQAIAQLEQVQQAANFGEREAARTQLEQYVQRFEGTIYALEARLLLGQVLLEQDAAAAAIEALAPAVRAMDDEPIGIQAAFLMAAAYEEEGRLEEAERLYLRIADTAELGFQIREALADAARLRTDAGDYAGAADLYADALATLDEESPERRSWEMRVAEATARAET